MFLPSRMSATRHCEGGTPGRRRKTACLQIFCQKSFLKISPVNSLSRSNGNTKKTSGADESLWENVFRILSCITLHHCLIHLNNLKSPSDSEMCFTYSYFSCRCLTFIVHSNEWAEFDTNKLFSHSSYEGGNVSNLSSGFCDIKTSLVRMQQWEMTLQWCRRNLVSSSLTFELNNMRKKTFLTIFFCLKTCLDI